MTTTITCRDAEDRLADWLEGTLDAGTAQAVAAHLRGCPACGALVASLDAPNPDVAALTDLRPERDLWAGIAARIEAPVLPLASAPAAHPVTRRRFGWVAQGAAAAALVTVTAGTTWMYAARVLGGASGTVAQVAAGAADGFRAAVPGTPDVPARPRTRAVAVDAALPALERTYEAEVSALRGILRERRADMDPRTVAVLEKNLKVIDQAIAESRAALAKDPANPLAGDQLARTLDQKLQLLRTAALLPPRA
jgi:anti-sigma factor RsiW